MSRYIFDPKGLKNVVDAIKETLDKIMQDATTLHSFEEKGVLISTDSFIQPMLETELYEILMQLMNADKPLRDLLLDYYIRQRK